MKTILIVLLTVSTFVLNAQSEIYSGDYENINELTNGDLFEYKITLNTDGTFVYHSHSIIAKGIPPEKNLYGKGSWSAEKNIITLSTDNTDDLNEMYSLNLDNTKARYRTKSPRDKSNRAIPTELLFFQSDIFWVKGKRLLKVKIIN